MGARIRAAVADDARSIALVHVDSWRAAYRGELPDDYLDSLSVDDRERTWRGALLEPAPRSAILVAEGDDGGLVGFVSCGPAREEGGGEDTGEVFAIYLEPPAFGAGVGRELFASANERLRAFGYRRAILWVLETNARARRFYEAAGWRWDGARSTHQADCMNLPIVRYAAEL